MSINSVPLSIHLELERDTAADLVTVARASLALSDLIKRAALLADPQLDFRVELVSGTEGSLILNSRIRGLAEKAKDKRALITLVVLAALAIGGDIRSWSVSQILDWAKANIIETEAAPSSEEEEQLRSTITEAVTNQVAERISERFFSALESDHSIQAVGVSSSPNIKPAYFVERSEFPERSGQLESDLEETERTRFTETTLVLVAPILKPSKKMWRFIGETGEFSAEVHDSDFLDAIYSGSLEIPMVAGIQMDVELSIKEVREGPVWSPRKFVIERVRSYRAPGHQQKLPFPPRHE